MEKPLDVRAFLASVNMSGKRAEEYPPRTSVISIEEVQRIIRELREDAELDKDD
jgi:hypothetical protein